MSRNTEFERVCLIGQYVIHLRIETLFHPLYFNIMKVKKQY